MARKQKTSLEALEDICTRLRASERTYRISPTAKNLAARDELLGRVMAAFSAVDRRLAKYAKVVALTGQHALIDMLHDEGEVFIFEDIEWFTFLDLADPAAMHIARLYGLSTKNCFRALMLKCAAEPQWLEVTENKNFLNYFRWRLPPEEFLHALVRNPEISKPLARLFEFSCRQDMGKAAVHARAHLVKGSDVSAKAYFLAGARIPETMGQMSDPIYKASNLWIAEQASHHGQMAIYARIGTDLEAYLRSVATDPASRAIAMS
jgi:hypothetical protein